MLVGPFHAPTWTDQGERDKLIEVWINPEWAISVHTAVEQFPPGFDLQCVITLGEAQHTSATPVTESPEQVVEMLNGGLD